MSPAALLICLAACSLATAAGAVPAAKVGYGRDPVLGLPPQQPLPYRTAAGTQYLYPTYLVKPSAADRQFPRLNLLVPMEAKRAVGGMEEEHQERQGRDWMTRMG